MNNIEGALTKHITEKEIIEITKDLVRLKSYSGIKNQEAGVAQYIHEFFIREGIDRK